MKEVEGLDLNLDLLSDDLQSEQKHRMFIYSFYFERVQLKQTGLKGKVG